MQRFLGSTRPVGWLLIAILVTAQPVHAQAPNVDALLERIFNAETRAPYDLTAAFTGTVAFSAHDGHWVGTTIGTFHEWRTAEGQSRHWKVTVERLDLPILLRPFASAVQHAIEEKAAAQTESLENLHSHDLFVLDQSQGSSYVLAGVRHDLVDDAIDRYGHGADKADARARRAIEQWLYTAPTMRDAIKRGDGPYAMQAASNDHGLVHALTLFYTWGQLDMTFEYIMVEGRPFWRAVHSVISSDVKNVGRVDGELTLTFTRHRLTTSP